MSLVRSFILASISFSTLFATNVFAQSLPFDPKPALEATIAPLPCHLLRSRISYVYPSYTMLNSEIRYFPSTPVKGFRYDTQAWTNANGPIGLQSIEYQRYNNGEKLIIVPYVKDESPNAVVSWVVYEVHKEAKILKYWKYAPYPNPTDPSNQPIKYNVVADGRERAAILKAREREDFWSLPTWRTLGYQSPYRETIWERDGNIEFAPGQTVYTHNYYTNIYVQETCRPVAVHTPTEMSDQIYPRLGTTYPYCANTRSLTSDPTENPQCLATKYLAGVRDEAAWQQFLHGISFVPVAGSVAKIYECTSVGDAYCWGEAAASVLTDAATLVVPVSKFAAASKYARVAAIGNAGKSSTGVFFGLAASGQGLLGGIDLLGGDEGKALARFVVSGLHVFQLSGVNSNAGKVNSIKRLKDTGAPKKTCWTAKKTSATGQCDDAAGVCYACQMDKGAVKSSAFRDLHSKLTELQATSAPFTDPAFSIPVGEDLYRGLTSRYIDSTDGVRWLMGNDEGVFMSHRLKDVYRSKFGSASPQGFSVGDRRKFFNEAIEEVAAEVDAEVAATVSSRSGEGWKLMDWTHLQQKLTHRTATAAEQALAQAMPMSASKDLARKYANANPWSTGATRPSFVAHVKAKNGGYIHERVGTTGAREAYKVGFLDSDDAAGLYVKLKEDGRWFFMKRTEKCEISVSAANGEDLDDLIEIARVNRMNMDVEIPNAIASNPDASELFNAIKGEFDLATN